MNIHCFPHPTAPFMSSNGLCVSALPTRQSSFPDRKSLQGLSPHHRWPFNTSLATANEPGVAAAWLDPADFAQMFISRSPAVLGWEVHFNLGLIFFCLFIYFCLFVTGSTHLKFGLGRFFFFEWLCSWNGMSHASFYFPASCWTNTVSRKLM